MKVQCACHIAALRWSHSDLIGRSAVWELRGDARRASSGADAGLECFSDGVIRSRDKTLSLSLPTPTNVESACVLMTG